MYDSKSVLLSFPFQPFTFKMYLRDIYVEHDKEVLYQLIQDHPLGLLTTVIPSLSGEEEWPLIQQTHLPWIVEKGKGENGEMVLKGHIAKANPQAKQLIKLVNDEQRETFPEWNTKEGSLKSKFVTISFTHPIQSYVTPKYYTESKPKHGKVVPTWNYAAVEVRGRLKVIDRWNDEKLHEILTKLTQENEVKNLQNRQESQTKKPWTMEESPQMYTDLLKKAIIGLEVEIESICGKFKMSQDRQSGDLQGVLQGFTTDGTQMGKGMAELVNYRASLKPSS